MTAKSKADPKQAGPVLFGNGRADFSQQGFSAKETVDGTTNSRKGWAVSPSFGQTHWAVFDVKTPAGYDGGTVLTFALMQNYDDTHQIGRFRISVTTAKPPLPVGLAPEYADALKTPAAKRTKAQAAVLAKHVKATDKEYATLTAAVAEARTPVPTDPKLIDLRAAVADASQPVPEDAVLAQLKQDVEYSQKQSTNVRLVGTQDIAWALINSPSFLFNR